MLFICYVYLVYKIFLSFIITKNELMFELIILRRTHINYNKLLTLFNFSNFRSYDVLEEYATQKLFEYSSIVIDCIQKSNQECIRYIDKKYKHMAYTDRGVKLSYTNKTFIYPKHLPKFITAIISIPLSPDQFSERIALRKTRCHSNQLKEGVICLFFCGIDISNPRVNELIAVEGKKYNDIIQFDFVNDYINLTTLQLSTFNWLVKNTPNIQYYIRTDSDVFIQNSQIWKYISMRRKLFTYGAYWENSKPQRLPHQKWYMPYSLYPYDHYKPYHSGMLYIWSRDILDLMMDGINHVKPIHYIDDVYFGQILHYYNVSLERSEHTYRSPLPLSQNISNEWQNVVAIHGYTPVELLCIDALLRNKYS